MHLLRKKPDIGVNNLTIYQIYRENCFCQKSYILEIFCIMKVKLHIDFALVSDTTVREFI